MTNKRRTTIEETLAKEIHDSILKIAIKACVETEHDFGTNRMPGNKAGKAYQCKNCRMWKFRNVDIAAILQQTKPI